MQLAAGPRVRVMLQAHGALGARLLVHVDDAHSTSAAAVVLRTTVAGESFACARRVGTMLRSHPDVACPGCGARLVEFRAGDPDARRFECGTTKRGAVKGFMLCATTHEERARAVALYRRHLFEHGERDDDLG